MNKRPLRRGNKAITVTLVENFEWDLLERLLTNITYRGSCWIRGKDQSVYTQVLDGSKMRRAHRVSYEIFKGKKLRYLGCHHCDVPACINPEHIFDGTNGDNRRDALAKGRWRNIPLESKAAHDNKIDTINKQHMDRVIRQKANLTREEVEYRNDPFNLLARLRKLIPVES